ncbi:hypothetical protein [Kitasatospora sp. NPDC005748]|uniref:hypothetical protein n=1 Tax=Kitasatospora sp. NPDC005748 TaxID=3157063 RepID=UPI0033EDA4E8
MQAPIPDIHGHEQFLSEHCVLICGAARDVKAGNAAGVPTIGYANKPGKDAKPSAAGAMVIVDSTQSIGEALTQ